MMDMIPGGRSVMLDALEVERYGASIFFCVVMGLFRELVFGVEGLEEGTAILG